MREQERAVFDEMREKAISMKLDGRDVFFRIPAFDEIKEIADFGKTLKDDDPMGMSRLFAKCLAATIATGRQRTEDEWLPILVVAKESGTDTELANVVVRSLTLCGFEASARVVFKEDQDLLAKMTHRTENDPNAPVDHIEEAAKVIGKDPT